MPDAVEPERRCRPDVSDLDTAWLTYERRKVLTMFVSTWPRVSRMGADAPLLLAALRVPQTERRILVEHRANALVVGSAPSTEAVLLALEPLLLDPLTLWQPASPLTLPERGGTLVMRNVGQLSATAQATLVEWFGRDTFDTQVISTSPVPLYPLVEQGRFSDTLYYRLNTVYVELPDR